jgi:hypothetical protein
MKIQYKQSKIAHNQKQDDRVEIDSQTPIARGYLDVTNAVLEKEIQPCPREEHLNTKLGELPSSKVARYENSDDHGPATKPPNGSEQGMESSVEVVINCFVLEGVPNASTSHRQQQSILRQKRLPELICRLQMDGGSPTYLAV